MLKISSTDFLSDSKQFIDCVIPTYIYFFLKKLKSKNVIFKTNSSGFKQFLIDSKKTLYNLHTSYNSYNLHT